MGICFLFLSILIVLFDIDFVYRGQFLGESKLVICFHTLFSAVVLSVTGSHVFALSYSVLFLFSFTRVLFLAACVIIMGESNSLCSKSVTVSLERLSAPFIKAYTDRALVSAKELTTCGDSLLVNCVTKIYKRCSCGSYGPLILVKINGVQFGVVSCSCSGAVPRRIRRRIHRRLRNCL